MAISNDKKKVKAYIQRELVLRELARRYFKYYIQYIYPKYDFTPFHDAYIKILQAFIDGKIKKLMLSVPPQHGKSLLASRLLPAYLFGLTPEANAAVVSYSTAKARRMGGAIKMLMASDEYKTLFSLTKLPDPTDKYAINTSEIVDVLGGSEPGKLLLTGRGGGLTGDPVDWLLLDDLYKNASEANSPVIRQNVVDWYNMVADSRLHNESRQLMVFTRWHDEDLQGYIEKTEGVINLETWGQVEGADPARWYKINFEALKEGPLTEIDPRENGLALYPKRHSAKKLNATKTRLLQGNPEDWRCLYQGDPRPITGLLYGAGFKEYDKLPELRGRFFYGDTADTGGDWTCLVAYAPGEDGYMYILDVYYSPAAGEVTEPEAAEFIIKNKCVSGIIESNSGGRAWARAVERIIRERGKAVMIEKVPQTKNKESRILTAAPGVMAVTLMPQGWAGKFPAFAGDLLGFRRLFKANTRDDAPDALTGAYEHSGLTGEEEIYIDSF